MRFGLQGSAILSPSGKWKCKASFERRTGGVYLIFTTGSGDSLEFRIESGKLVGTNKSARWENSFDLS